MPAVARPFGVAYAAVWAFNAPWAIFNVLRHIAVWVTAKVYFFLSVGTVAATGKQTRLRGGTERRTGTHTHKISSFNEKGGFPRDGSHLRIYGQPYKYAVYYRFFFFGLPSGV